MSSAHTCKHLRCAAHVLHRTCLLHPGSAMTVPCRDVQSTPCCPIACLNDGDERMSSIDIDWASANSCSTLQAICKRQHRCMPAYCPHDRTESHACVKAAVRPGHDQVDGPLHTKVHLFQILDARFGRQSHAPLSHSRLAGCFTHVLQACSFATIRTTLHLYEAL